MPVIAALKFDDEVALRHPACQAYCAHGCFCAAGDEANLLNKRNRPRNQRGKFQLQFGRDAKTCAAARLIGNRRADGGIRVSQDHRPPGAHEIKQLVSVRVVEVLTTATLDDQRLSAHRAERSDRAVHAANQHFLGALKNLARTLPFAIQSGLHCTHVVYLETSYLSSFGLPSDLV